MSTLDESQTVNDLITAAPAVRQDYEIANPVVVSGSVQGPSASTSHDHSSNTCKAETLISYAEKFRFITTFVMDKSKKRGDRLYTSSFDIHTVNVLLGKMFRSYILHKFTFELKFTIYSSSQQQGALIFAQYPFDFSRMSGIGDNSGFGLGDIFQDTYYSSPVDIPSIALVAATQSNHTIISLGAETEVILKLPFCSSYDSYMYDYDYAAFFAQVQVLVFDPMQCNAATNDVVTIRLEARRTDIDVSAPIWETTGPISVGEYAFGTS